MARLSDRGLAASWAWLSGTRTAAGPGRASWQGWRAALARRGRRQPSNEKEGAAAAICCNALSERPPASARPLQPAAPPRDDRGSEPLCLFQWRLPSPAPQGLLRPGKATHQHTQHVGVKEKQSLYPQTRCCWARVFQSVDGATGSWVAQPCSTDIEQSLGPRSPGKGWLPLH